MLEGHLKKFARRVRWMRAWRGIAIGGAIGAALAGIWAALDWAGVLFADWLGLGLVFGAAAILGGLIGVLRRVDARDVAQSIDRRAGLEDRLGTALEPGSEKGFLGAVREDADRRLLQLRPAQVFPVRMSRWHGAACCLAVVAAGLFLLGNTPLLLSDQKKAERKELKEAGATVERVAKPIEKNDGATPKEKALARDLERFARELEKGRLEKVDAMQKANELAKKADELTRERYLMAKEQLVQAESAFDKLTKAELQKAGLEDIDPEIAKMDPEQRAAEASKVQSELDQMAKEMAEKGSQMSPQERAAMENRMKELQSRMQDLKLSKEVQDMLDRIRNHPIYKELQEMAAKMQQAAEKGERGEAPELTEEEIEQMRQRLEELAEMLKDDEALREYLEALKEALKECEGACEGAGIGLGLLGLFPGNGGRSKDDFFANTERVNKLEEEAQGQGTTNSTMVKGERGEQGEETYIEIKGPTSTGARSSVPYQKVLPNYKKKAEEALKRKAIPKEHEKRVKEYFDSLGKG
ncbi:MAG TPA: hypothetical protein PLL78_06845 [Fimbriimonadaceae bacterium]|nr:hypothetical protein [Fimbriimonadaceae bacterium]HRJ96387.1 hypothetical protein [Fimbriimonadaceae bacterium]